MPFSGTSRPTKSSSGGSASPSLVAAGSSTPLRITRTFVAPRPRTVPATASETATATRTRRTSSRRSGGKRLRSATSEPCSVVTSGRPEASAGATVGSQWAWTRSAPRAARRTVRAIEARSGGIAHGLRFAFFVSPAP
jgi:hypothetical protein